MTSVRPKVALLNAVLALSLPSCVDRPGQAHYGAQYTGVASASITLPDQAATDYVIGAKIKSACSPAMTMTLKSAGTESPIVVLEGATPTETLQHMWLTASPRTLVVSDPGGCSWLFTMSHAPMTTPTVTVHWR